MALAVDLSQNIERMPRYGRRFWSLTRTAEPYSVTKEHFYTASELEYLYGWPVLEAFSKKYAHCLHSKLGSVRQRERRAMLGNSVHLPTIAAFLQYCLGRTRRRDPAADASELSSFDICEAGAVQTETNVKRSGSGGYTLASPVKTSPAASTAEQPGTPVIDVE